jgi:DNA-binding MarR family transcriptional regulator
VLTCPFFSEGFLIFGLVSNPYKSESYAMRSIQSADQRQAPFVYFDIELDDMGLTPFEYRAYGRIARRASGGQRACTESLDAMAAGCQMSRRTLINAIKGLIQRGMVKRESKLGDTSTYYLTDKSAWVGSAPRAQGVVQEMPTPGAPRAQGVVHHVPTKNTREENKKREGETPAAPPPIKASTTVNDLGDILEDAYPGHATNWRTMRDLRELVNRVNATRSDVLAFPGWLERNHPRKANTPFAFKDLFAEMVRSQQAATAKQSTPSYCGECQSGWMLTDTGATPCNCSRSNNESHNHRATVNA